MGDVELVLEVIGVMLDRDGVAAILDPQGQPGFIIQPVEHVGLGPDEAGGFIQRDRLCQSCGAHAVIILFHC
jgi:hypothetical protein